MIVDPAQKRSYEFHKSSIQRRKEFERKKWLCFDQPVSTATGHNSFWLFLKIISTWWKIRLCQAIWQGNERWHFLEHLPCRALERLKVQSMNHTNSRLHSMQNRLFPKARFSVRWPDRWSMLSLRGWLCYLQLVRRVWQSPRSLPSLQTNPFVSWDSSLAFSRRSRKRWRNSWSRGEVGHKIRRPPRSFLATLP